MKEFCAHYYIEDQGFYKGQQFLHVFKGPDWNESYNACGKSKQGLLKDICDRSGWHVTKENCVWIDDPMIDTNNDLSLPRMLCQDYNNLDWKNEDAVLKRIFITADQANVFLQKHGYATT